MNAAQVCRPVVAGVDGSDSALEAVRWAAREAHRRRVPLRLVSAFGWTTGHHLGDPGFGTDYITVLLQKARDEVAAAAATARPGTRACHRARGDHRLPGSGPERRGRPRSAGGTGRPRTRRIHRAPGGIGGCRAGHPRAVPGRGGPRPGAGLPPSLEGPVVVGIDGSPTSEAALAFAFEAADLRGVPLMAVHTWTDYQIESTMVAVLEGDAIDADEHRLLSERLAGWSEKYPDVPVQRLVTRYRPAATLVGAVPACAAGGRGVARVAAGSPGCCWARSATPCCTTPGARSRSYGPPPRRRPDRRREAPQHLRTRVPCRECLPRESDTSIDTGTDRRRPSGHASVRPGSLALERRPVRGLGPRRRGF